MGNMFKQLFSLIFALSVSVQPALAAFSPLAAPIGSIQLNGGNNTFTSANNNAASQTALSTLIGQPPYYATNYGAVCNGKQLSDITTTATSATISSASYTFTSADVGKYITINAGTAVSSTGTTVLGSITVTGLASTTGLAVNQSVVGTGIPAGTVIADVVSSTSVNLSKLATGSASVTIKFYPLINTTISSVSGGNAVLATTMTSSVSGVALATFGTDDTANLQSAITAAGNAGGGQLVLPLGTCVVTTSLQGANKVSITGQGAGRSIVFWLSLTDQAGRPVFNWFTGGGCSLTSALTRQDNHFTYFEIDETAATDASFNVSSKGISAPCTIRSVIDHMYVHDTPTTSVATDDSITQVTNSVFKNCGRLASNNYGGNCIGEGLSGSFANESYVMTGNIMINPNHWGAYLEGQGATTYPVAATISDNTCYQGYLSQGSAGGTSYCVGMAGSIGGVVSGNHIYGISGAAANWSGIGIANGTQTSDSAPVNINVTGNMLYNGVAIVLNYSTKIPSGSLKALTNISNNVVIGPSNLGIELIPSATGSQMDGVEISNNIVSGAGSCGIGILGSGAATNIGINNNILSNNGTTLSTYRASGVCFNVNTTGLTMVGNQIYDNGTGTQKYAIAINTGITIAGANIQDNALSGATSTFDLLGTLTGSVLNNTGVDQGTKFTTTGCSISATSGTATSGTFTLGANSCTAVITPNGATGTGSIYTGWSCSAWDQTAPTVLIGGNSSSTATTASFTIPAGAGATDVIGFNCQHYPD